ncbi:hypothetical protein ACTWLT_12485 [Micromonospora sp. ZYX-F-536]
MTHGVSFTDEHGHDPHGGRSAVPAPGRAGVRQAGRAHGRAGHRHR